MKKIIILSKNQQTNYFDINYIFTLEIPQSQIGKENADITKEINGIASYKDDTSIEDIKSDLEKKYTEEQNKLNADTKLSFYGMSWDGVVWTDK